MERGLRAQGSGVRAQGSGLGAQGSGIRAQGSGLGARGSRAHRACARATCPQGCNCRRSGWCARTRGRQAQGAVRRWRRPVPRASVGRRPSGAAGLGVCVCVGGGGVKVGEGAVFLVRASEGAGPVSRALLEADGAAPRRRGWVAERGGGWWEWGYGWPGWLCWLSTGGVA